MKNVSFEISIHMHGNSIQLDLEAPSRYNKYIWENGLGWQDRDPYSECYERFRDSTSLEEVVEDAWTLLADYTPCQRKHKDSDIPVIMLKYLDEDRHTWQAPRQELVIPVISEDPEFGTVIKWCRIVYQFMTQDLRVDYSVLADRIKQLGSDVIFYYTYDTITDVINSLIEEEEK